MSGNYPDGVNENTRGAPWNEYETVTCSECHRFYYPAEFPSGIPADNETRPPLTEYGQEFELCETCEHETSTCERCGERHTVTDGHTARAVDGCVICLEPGACPVCRASHFLYIGQLGNVLHFRCKYCGVETSREQGKGEL